MTSFYMCLYLSIYRDFSTNSLVLLIVVTHAPPNSMSSRGGSSRE
jgi:hypothetical protein